MILKPIRFLSFGLWLPSVRAEVQEVRKAHRKECYICAKLPRGLRLHLQSGSGRGALMQILCRRCGARWVQMILREGARALGVLRGTITDGKPIRLGWSPKHRRSIKLRTALRPKKKVKS